MKLILAQATDDSTPQTVTTGIYYSWLDVPMAVALLFAFAGAVFVCIYFLRRRRSGVKE
jgi:hypothetical protein